MKNQEAQLSTSPKAKSPRRKRVKDALDINICPDYLKPAHHHNATQSRLLSLPAEIRFCIFEMIIGAPRCIEVAYACPGQKLKTGIALHGLSETVMPGPDVKGLYLAHKDDYDVFPRPHSASGLWATTTKTISSFHPLNRICRQIYLESAILPYTMHTYAFGDISHLQVWVGSLTLQQKVAIRSVFYADYDTTETPVQASAMLELLPGLTKLFLPRSYATGDSKQMIEWVWKLKGKGVKLWFLKDSVHIKRYL